MCFLCLFFLYLPNMHEQINKNAQSLTVLLFREQYISTIHDNNVTINGHSFILSLSFIFIVKSSELFLTRNYERDQLIIIINSGWLTANSPHYKQFIKRGKHFLIGRNQLFPYQHEYILISIIFIYERNHWCYHLLIY